MCVYMCSENHCQQKVKEMNDIFDKSKKNDTDYEKKKKREQMETVCVCVCTWRVHSSCVSFQVSQLFFCLHSIFDGIWPQVLLGRCVVSVRHIGLGHVAKASLPGVPHPHPPLGVMHVRL